MGMPCSKGLETQEFDTLDENVPPNEDIRSLCWKDGDQNLTTIAVMPRSRALILHEELHIEIPKQEPQYNRAKLLTGCTFCKRNGKTEEYCMNHQLKDNYGNITCPVLFSYVCPICGATKTKAHTYSYCPLRKQKDKPPMDKKASFDRLLTGCAFCKRNGETEEYCMNHQLKDSYGNITCPVLFMYVCPICGATKTKAHTYSYCPLRKQKDKPPMDKKAFGALSKNTPRNSTHLRQKKSY